MSRPYSLAGRPALKFPQDHPFRTIKMTIAPLPADAVSAAHETLARLPVVRGRYTEGAALGVTGWFQCGGGVDVLFKPADRDDLSHFLRHCPSDIPVHIFGALSNTIIRDGGLRGVAIRLGREFMGVEIAENHSEENVHLAVGCGLLDTHLAAFAAEHGIAGFEFLAGIPGTLGGAIRMNAGAIGATSGDVYGQTCLRDVLVSATVLDRQGNSHTVTPDTMTMTYRHTDAPEDWIFIACVLRGHKDAPDAIAARMAALKERRETAQPIREKTGGSTFANPTPAALAAAGLPDNTRCWQLIDAAGCRGLEIGGARMSDKHCNFMINTGTATATDLESLGEAIREKVRAQSGIDLRWEIKRLGDRG